MCAVCNVYTMYTYTLYKVAYEFIVGWICVLYMYNNVMHLMNNR